MYQDFDMIEPSPLSLPLPTSTPPPPSQPPPQFTRAGRPKRNYQLPARYKDVNPEPLRPLEAEIEQPTAVLPCLCLIVCNRLWTAANSFGLLREYLYQPSFDPNSFISEEDLHQVGGIDHTSLPPSPIPVHRNESVEMLMNWKDSGTSTKSDAGVNRLVKDVLLDPDFKLEDLQGFNVARENQRSLFRPFSNGHHQH